MLRPFKAVRPTRDKAYLVATRSYVSYAPSQLEDKLNNNPFTFLHIINPEALKNETAEVKYAGVRQRFLKAQEQGIFLQEEQTTYYLYQQKSPQGTFEGIIGLLDLRPNAEVSIIKHENTLAQKEALFATYLEYTGFQAEPILAFGASDTRRTEILESIKESRPEYEFSSTDRYEHRVWLVPSQWNSELEQSLAKVRKVYLADGHHRLASTERVAQHLSSNPKAQGVLCMFMDEERLDIKSFERWLQTSDIAFHIDMLKDSFEITPDVELKDVDAFDLQMFLEGTWYGLVSRNPEKAALKPQLLLDELLEPYFHVKDARNDLRLRYVPQTDEDRHHAQQLAGYDVGFRLPAVSVELLKKTGEDGGVMPPKSTYIEPKLRSGLLLHVFK